MEKIKYIATTTQDKDKIQVFAEFKGYNNFKLENETHEEYVARKFKEHADSFTTEWANHRIREATEAYKQNLETQILEPIKDATIVTFENIT